MKCLKCSAHRHREKIKLINKKIYLISICIRCGKEIDMQEVKLSNTLNEWVPQ